MQLRAAVTIQAGTRRVLARLRKRRLNVLKRLQADDLELRADYHAMVVQAAWRQHVLRRRGVSAATWESLAGAGGACRGATAEQVEARFAWLCDAAKKQKCASAARGGKPKGKPRKPKPRG